MVNENSELAKDMQAGIDAIRKDYEMRFHLVAEDFLKPLIFQRRKLKNPILIVWRAFYYNTIHKGDIYDWWYRKWIEDKRRNEI